MPATPSPSASNADCALGTSYGLLLSHAERCDGPRRQAEHFVADVYARHYEARISQFLPVLLGLEAADGHLVGVIGARPGAPGIELFLEAYLDRPIEALLAERCGHAVRRSDLAEVGNLSSAGNGHGTALITSLAAWLDGAEIPWAVFTATGFLRALFGRLGVRPGGAHGARAAGRGVVGVSAGRRR